MMTPAVPTSCYLDATDLRILEERLRDLTPSNDPPANRAPRAKRIMQIYLAGYQDERLFLREFFRETTDEEPQ